MKAIVKEKGDGKILVEFEVTSPHEALIMSMLAMGTDDSVAISTESSYGMSKVRIGAIALPVIEQLMPQKTK